MPSKDINIYPHFVENEYRFIFNNSGDTIIDSVSLKYSEIKDYKFIEPTKDGYSFAGWYTDKERTNPYNNEIPNDDVINLYSKYIKNKYKVTILEENNPLEFNFDYDSKIDLPNIFKGGYNLEGLYLDETYTIKFEYQNMSSKDLMLYPHFVEIRYNLNVFIPNEAYGSINGDLNQSLKRNELSKEIEAIPNLGYKFIGWSNGDKNNKLSISINEDTIIYPYFEIDDLELPIMKINTLNKEEIVSKDIYLNCNVSVSNTIYEYRFDNLEAKVKGRGNSTWTMPKKPFKLKFNSKVDLFGNGLAKTWTLIANYSDKSLIRNYMAYNIGELVESDYCTKTEMIVLYLNDEYLEVYLICEQNEVGKTRVDIDESYDNQNTGYLLELDGRAPDEGLINQDYIVVRDIPFAIKSPDVDDERFNLEYINYIKQYLEETFEALDSKDINLLNNYLNIESFAKAYIVHELLNFCDVGFSSFYIYKDKDGLLCAGPLWDFDLSSGNAEHVVPANSPNNLYAKDTNIFYFKLYEFDDFKNAVKSILNEKYSDIKNKINEICDYALTLSHSFERNFIKWDILSIYVCLNPQELVNITTWQGQVEYLRNWLIESMDFINSSYI
jgi:uncharacterized repeat protein (TIGR02543 family)